MSTVLYLLQFIVGNSVAVETLTSNRTVSDSVESPDPHLLDFTPSGANRTVSLPTPGSGNQGVPYLIHNGASAGGYSLLVAGGTSASPSPTTIGTIGATGSAVAICYFDGTVFRWRYIALTYSPATLADLALTGLLTQTTTQAASGTTLSTTTTATSATGSPVGAKVAVLQGTNAKTSGTTVGLEIDMAGLAGDTSGAVYVHEYLTTTPNGGSAKYYARRLLAGFTAVDDLSLLNSGTAITLIRDNVAIGWGIYEGANPYIYAVSTDSAERLVVAKTLKLLDAAGSTKAMEFDVSAVTGGQTRTLTMADFTVNLNTGPFSDNADIVVPISTISFFAVSGTWVRSRSAAADYKIARSAAATVETLAVEVPTQTLRTTASKGRKITGLKIKYSIATAAANDVTVNLLYTVVPTNTAAVAAAANLGTVTYDANHDTSAKRKGIGEHTMQVTFGTPVFFTDGFCEVQITVDAALTTVFVVSQIELLATENFVDAT